MKYTTPEMEIVRFESMEVIVASTETTSSKNDNMDNPDWG